LLPDHHRVTLVLFDIDLTLVHTNGAGRAAVEEALLHLYGRARLGGLDAGATSGMRFDGRTDRSIFEETVQRLGEPFVDLDALTAAYLERLPSALVAKGGHVLPGVFELLERLACEPVAVGLATGNIREGAMAKLRHFGLADRFLAGGFGDHHSERSLVVQEGLEALAEACGRDCRAEDCIVVGDTPLDVAAAKAIGARALAVATGSYGVRDLAASGADWVLPDLSDTLRVVTILARTPAT
jgi:phosphoglycolate phosphatase-like HAD superfamily hydrolase